MVGAIFIDFRVLQRSEQVRRAGRLSRGISASQPKARRLYHLERAA